MINTVYNPIATFAIMALDFLRVQFRVRGVAALPHLRAEHCINLAAVFVLGWLCGFRRLAA
jgi:hypothetical protein